MAPLTISTAYSKGLPDWNNLDVLHKGTLPPRAYFHVYDSEANALTYDVEKARTHSLSGIWKFQHASSPFEVPDGYPSPEFDVSSWSDIAVPGMWQLQGFGKRPQYTNVQFHIPVDPPNVSFTDNETGCYVRKFSVPDRLKGRQIRLRFEGVDSSFHVWVNGREVGYSQGSRNPDEFDITEYVNEEGDNTLAVQVYQLCDGTYIEDQDQWWLSGIFRDVSLIGFPKQSRIEDINVHTVLDEDYVHAELKVKLTLNGPGKIDMKLLDAQKQEVKQVQEEHSGDTDVKEITIPIANPLKWTAESPYLYHLVVSLESEQYLAHRVGFRQVEMKDGLLKVNGQRIVFRGVNRHEHHPKFGRTVPSDFLKQDLLIMKSHNINAIRTSHQLNDPRLLSLADEMGFWVMDEADVECHGFESIEDAALGPDERKLPFAERRLLTWENAAKWTTDNPAWTHAYVDRAVHLVKRDQLHPSVIIWSLGNEAFFGQNFKAMYEWIKAHDDSRPVHYEADIDAETMDMYSRMYSFVDEIIAFAEDESKNKPLILCEFVHAMGNGPGNIKKYMDAFYKYPALQGGFAWEWANHGLETKDKTTGETFYGYGGDFGEEVHDGTFVMDGLVRSDHTPTPGLIEYKKAIEPVQLVEATPGGKAKFINRYDFITLNHLSCSGWLTDHAPVQHPRHAIEMPSNVGPGETFEIQCPEAPDGSSECLYTISFQLKEATPYLEAGFEVATAQIQLAARPKILKLPQPQTAPSTPTVNFRAGSQNTVEIGSQQNHWTFNTLHGALVSWRKHSTEVISSPPEINFFRAPTCNDIPQDGRDWQDKLLHLAKPSTRNVDVDIQDDAVAITVHQRMAPPVLEWCINCVLTYRFTADGLRVRVKGSPQGKNLPRTLPRIGLVMEMPHQWQHVQWFGRGPGESYRDSKESQLVRSYSVDSVDELWEDYEVPQESSNRTDTRWLSLSTGPAAQSDDKQSGVERLLVQFVDTSGEQITTFDWQASHYRMRDVAEAGHPHELRRKKREEVVLRLDWQHHGLGTGSCGPRTLDQYSLFAKEEFEFEIFMQ